MKLQNEFEVAVPVEEVWHALLDIQRVARFLPGATIEPSEEPDVYRGSMKVKLGPMMVTYHGTARLGQVDESQRLAPIEVEAREARGQGRASATIANRLVDLGDRTRVIAETDLRITGRQAQFGRGVMQDVAASMLGEFARRFEASLIEPPAAATNGNPPEVDGHTEPEIGPDDSAVEALDAGALLSQLRLVRYGGVAVGGLLVILLLRALRRRG